jgi:endonuclease-3
MKDDEIDKMIAAIRKMPLSGDEPVVSAGKRGKRDPFRVLISCLISLRTKDEVTGPAARRLFDLADNPASMGALPVGTIERAIYPAGFYRNKAEQIIGICRDLVANHGGEVPATIDELLKFKGVGRKTANMVVTSGHNRQGICVDIHVHRITNRWGYVATKNPDQTEMVLREKLPTRHWKPINHLLVTFGQQVCRPVSPRCSECPVEARCGRVGVARSR